ncbi:MAG: hypothetical protein HY719_06195, partial [Planctomycetes bacterium]|nr:hypothetical protein [Planctomycetota bacterium]
MKITLRALCFAVFAIGIVWSTVILSGCAAREAAITEKNSENGVQPTAPPTPPVISGGSPQDPSPSPVRLGRKVTLTSADLVGSVTHDECGVALKCDIFQDLTEKESLRLFTRPLYLPVRDENGMPWIKKSGKTVVIKVSTGQSAQMKQKICEELRKVEKYKTVTPLSINAWPATRVICAISGTGPHFDHLVSAPETLTGSLPEVMPFTFVARDENEASAFSKSYSSPDSSMFLRFSAEVEAYEAKMQGQEISYEMLREALVDLKVSPEDIPTLCFSQNGKSKILQNMMAILDRRVWSIGGTIAVRPSALDSLERILLGTFNKAEDIDLLSGTYEIP